MRINKLFHWLYFVLMSLPIFAMVSAVLVSTFNMSAKQESEIIYKYETNEVNSASDLIAGNVYTLHCKDLKPSDMQVYELFILPINNFTYKFHNIVEAYTDVDYSIYPLSYIYLSQNDIIELTYISDAQGDMYLNLDNVTFTSNIDFIFISKNIEVNVIINNILLQHISKCENIPIDHVETHNVETQDVFYNSLDKVANSPLFTWAQASFLGVPVSYLGGIFGLASNSVINILLCYWVAISIIWLMFDVLMFLPILVHKSIDKARF